MATYDSITTDICDFCGKKDAHDYCKQCNQALCDECKFIHEKGTTTSRHDILKLYSPSKEFEVEEKCVSHSEETLKFYCADCFTSVCVSCTSQKHDGHKIFLNRKLMAKLKNGSKSLDDIFTCVKNVQPILKESVSKYLMQNNLIRNQICEHIEMLQLMITKAEMMKKKLTSIDNSSIEKYETVKNKVKGFYKVKSMFEQTMKALEDKSVVDNPGCVCLVLEALNKMLVDKFTLIASENKKVNKYTLSALGFSFPTINYNVNGDKLLGTLAIVKEDEDGFESEGNKSFLEADSIKVPSVSAKPKPVDIPCQEPVFMGGLESRFGHRITLISGDITRVESDVIINFMNCRMEKEFSDISNILIKQAGKSVEDEIIEKLTESKFQFPPGHVITTRGGSLPCVEIVHCILPIRRNHYPEEQQLFRIAMTNAIKISLMHRNLEQKEISVSIPLDVGFSFGFPLEVVASMIFEEVASFMKYFEGNISVNVNLVGRENMALSVVLSNMESSILNLPYPEEPFGTILPSGVRLELIVGSICDADAHAILIAVHPSLNLSNGSISRQILEKAGQDIQKECLSLKSRNSFDLGDVIMTKGYNLKSKYVFHGHLGPPPDKHLEIYTQVMQTLLRKTFMMCAINNIASLALPALGTGIGLSGCISAALIMQEAYNFQFDLVRQSKLKKIVIVLHPGCKQIVDNFMDYLKALNPALRKPLWFAQNCDLSASSRHNINHDSMPKKYKSQPQSLENEYLVEQLKNILIDGNEEVTDGSFRMKELQGETKAARISWRYKDNSGKFVDYPEKINTLLEKNFQAKKYGTTWMEGDKVYRLMYCDMREEIVGTDDYADVTRFELP